MEARLNEGARLPPCGAGDPFHCPPYVILLFQQIPEHGRCLRSLSALKALRGSNASCLTFSERKLTLQIETRVLVRFRTG